MNALKNLYNSTFSIFMAKNKFGWRDEQHIKGDGISDIFNITINKDSPKNRLSDLNELNEIHPTNISNGANGLGGSHEL